MDDNDNVAQFMSITDQSAEVAQGCLSMTEGDVMAAVNMFFENPEIANSFNHPPSSAANATNAAPAAAPSQPQGASRRSGIGRQDNAGVIHIDEDDDDNDLDFDNILDESDSEVGPTGANNLQRIAQESDDAAMARRLQEEMYGGGGSGPGGFAPLGPDGVRAPIGRTTETLVAPSGFGLYGGGEDDDEEANDAFLREMRRRAAARPSKSQPPESCFRSAAPRIALLTAEAQ